MAQIQASPIAAHERDSVVEHLLRDARANLMLLDLVAGARAEPAHGEVQTQIVVAREDGRIVGVAALRPSVVLDAAMDERVIDSLVPFLDRIGVGLVKSPAPIVGALWQRLRRVGRRRALIDRFETAYALGAESLGCVPGDGPGALRPALASDLDPLVYAARESLREEGRPDPFAGDIRGFRSWVAARVPRARVVEDSDEIVFVSYADVQRAEGWLLQGIYTWRQQRRRGFARRGTAAACREAFASGADHVQLAVIEGNEAAGELYEGLGFRAFGRLRTILFS